jgi:hypothetical protein
MADVGANARLDCAGNWVANADAVDVRVLNDVTNGTGPGNVSDYNGDTHLTDPALVGGYPTIASGSPCADTDHDGMADAWEMTHFASLLRGSSSSSISDFDGDGYTDLEEFLNGTDPKSASTTPPSAPMNLRIR